MIRVKTCFVAEGVVTDRESGQVSAFNIFEDLQAPNFPVVVQKIAFFCLWERTATDPAVCRAEFSITLEGQVVVQQPVDINFEAVLRNRCTIRVDGFALERPGMIVFRLLISGHDIAEWSMIAAYAEPSVAAPSAVTSPSPRNVWDSGQLSTSIGTVDPHAK